MKRWLFFVIRRLFHRHNHLNHRVGFSKMSTAGIAIGVCALITVLAVMDGLQLNFIESILAIDSYHIRLRSEKPLDAGVLKSLRQLDEVKAVFPFADIQTLAENFTDYSFCQVKALPPDITRISADFKQQVNIVNGEFNLTDTNMVVVGDRLALSLGKRVGDRLELISLQQSGGGRAMLTEFLISGIFTSGYNEFNNSMLFINFNSAVKLGEQKQFSYGLVLNDRETDSAVLAQIDRLLPQNQGIRAESWRYYNRSFFSALFTEKMMMFILLALIFIVVAVNTFHGISRTVFERREEIATLQAIGCKRRHVKALFVWQGFFIGLWGALYGVVMGLVVSVNINMIFDYLDIFLLKMNQLLIYFGLNENLISSRFFVFNIDPRLFLSQITVIILFAILAPVFAAWLAARRVSRLNPAQILRYE